MMERDVPVPADVCPAANPDGEPAGEPPEHAGNVGHHAPSQAAMVFGIFALVFNVSLLFAVFGILLGIAAVILGSVNLCRHRHAKAGLVLGLISFVPPMAYVLTTLAIIRSDPLLF